MKNGDFTAREDQAITKVRTARSALPSATETDTEPFLQLLQIPTINPRA
jgi:hypothetical protein